MTAIYDCWIRKRTWTFTVASAGWRLLFKEPTLLLSTLFTVSRAGYWVLQSYVLYVHTLKEILLLAGDEFGNIHRTELRVLESIVCLVIFDFI